MAKEDYQVEYLGKDEKELIAESQVLVRQQEKCFNKKDWILFEVIDDKLSCIWQILFDRRSKLMNSNIGKKPDND